MSKERERRQDDIGLEDDPWNEDIAHLESPRHPVIESLRGAAGTLDRPLSSDRVKEIARYDRLERTFTREP